MCENDAAVDAYIEAVSARSMRRMPGDNQDAYTQRSTLSRGYLNGVIRELAATVPGVREWLIEHMPEVT